MSIQELSGDTRSRQKFAKASSPEDPHLICKLIGTEILGWIDFGWPGQSEFLQRRASHRDRFGKIRRSGWREPKYVLGARYGELRKEPNMNEQPISTSWRGRGGTRWVNILLGIWVVISPFVLAIYSFKAMWSNVATGAVIGILALVRWSMQRPGWSWLNLILGIWLVTSPFVLVISRIAMWNNVIVGIIIAASALTNTYFKESA